MRTFALALVIGVMPACDSATSPGVTCEDAIGDFCRSLFNGCVGYVFDGDTVIRTPDECISIMGGAGSVDNAHPGKLIGGCASDNGRDWTACAEASAQVPPAPPSCDDYHSSNAEDAAIIACEH